MNMKLAMLLLVCSISILGSANAAKTQDLVLEVDAIRELELGHDLSISLIFRNTGKQPVRLSSDTSADGFPVDVQISLRNERCRLVLLPARMSAGNVRRKSVTIPPGEAVPVRLPPLNRNILYQEIWPYAGRAWLEVQYLAPFGESEDAGLVRDVVSAAPVEVTFLPASADEIEKHRNELEVCLASGAFSCHQVVAYFASVIDTSAANLLVNLLERHPYLYFVATAIVAQRRAGDLPVLQAVSRMPDADAKYLSSAAAALDQHLRTGCIPSRAAARSQRDLRQKN